MNTVIRTALRTAMAILLAFVLAGTAVASEQPPVRPEQQRSWLVGRLVADMRAMGVFSGDEIAETVSLVSSLTEEQVGIFVRLYCVTREVAEQDARLLVVDSSETLVRLRRTIRGAYWELVAISPRCRTLCEVVYASIPGWCARCRYAVPGRYYRDGCYVGPCRSVRYGGPYSVRAYKTHFDSGSRHGGRHFHENIVRNPKGTHGIRYSHAAAKKRPHPKLPHGMARTTKHNPHPKAKHGSPTGAVKHRGPHKGRHVAARSAKHGGSPPKVRHGGPRSKSSPHSQPQRHRQHPKQATHGPKGKPAAHARHAAHGRKGHKSGHARHK